jgi:hypothetical protein
MTNLTNGGIPAPKQIRFVNNQGQPPSKRRRINAAYVVVSFSFTRLLLCPAPDLFFVWTSSVGDAAVACSSSWSVDDRIARIAGLTLIPSQMLNMPQTKDALRRREANMYHLCEERTPMSRLWRRRREEKGNHQWINEVRDGRLR